MTEQADGWSGPGAPPTVLPMRQRSDIIYQTLKQRLETVLPIAMREAGLDMWIILCQEDNPDPVYPTLIPMDTWCPILQILVFYDPGEGQAIEGINISGTNTQDLYDWPYRGQIEQEQWPLLRQIIKQRDPKRIGINTGSIQWAAGGLTHNLYRQLTQALPERYSERLTSAEALVTRWLATLSDPELVLYDHVVHLSRSIIAECYSRQVIVPGVTTTQDLVWYYWQRCADLGLQVSFKPFFGLLRSEAMRGVYGEDDQVIRPGDLLRCDVGLRYLRLNTDHQQTAYVRRDGESDAPAGLSTLFAHCAQLQDVFMDEFDQGLTGNELLTNILARARREGIHGAKVYSHSLGHMLHEPGPLIGLPWEQNRCDGRGDVSLRRNYCFTMELCVSGPVPEWDGQVVRLAQEEDVCFTAQGCRPINGRQERLILV